MGFKVKTGNETIQKVSKILSMPYFFIMLLMRMAEHQGNALVLNLLY